MYLNKAIVGNITKMISSLSTISSGDFKTEINEYILKMDDEIGLAANAIEGESNDFAKYCCIQNRYSYLTPNKDADFGVQRYFNREYLDKVKDLEDVKLLGYSPLLNGYYYKKDNLSKKYINDGVADKMQELEKVASKLNVLPGEVVLAWMIQNNPSVIPLIAVSSIEQLNLNLKALDIKLSKEDILKLNK